MLEQTNPFSPLRVFDHAGGGDLRPGEIGVLMAPPGTGKTTLLAQIGLDHLLHGRRVAHVSLEHPVDRVRSWYDESLKELAEAWSALDFTLDQRVDTERRRVIFSYHTARFCADRLGQQLRLTAAHQDFRPQVVIVDGYDWTAATRDEIAAMRALAGELSASFWFSARSVPGSRAEPGAVPPPCSDFADLLDVVMFLQTHAGGVSALRTIKAHSASAASAPGVRIDPRTMLVALD